MVTRDKASDPLDHEHTSPIASNRRCAEQDMKLYSINHIVIAVIVKINVLHILYLVFLFICHE